MGCPSHISYSSLKDEIYLKNWRQNKISVQQVGSPLFSGLFVSLLDLRHMRERERDIEHQGK